MPCKARVLFAALTDSLRHQPLFVVTFAAMAAAGMPAALATAAMGGLVPPRLPPPRMFMPFTGTPRFAAPAAAPPPAYAPVYALRRAGAAHIAAPALQCGACAARLATGTLCVARSVGRDDAGRQLFHLRCAAGAPWAAQLPLQPMLRDHHARPPAGEAPLTERELATVYEELGSDAQRARRRTPG